jgi:pimeloyl-ACP methyl ester carboxylesterase
MKNLILLILFIGYLPLWGQGSNGIAKIDTGAINGANYKIIFPENWQKKLVMFAHGYEFMGSKPRQSQNPDWVKRMAPFIERGYAVAASDYRIQGFALPEGVDDTENLRKYFFKKYGKPDSTFMVGSSMGGGISLAIMENFDKNYNGALPLCPFASRAYLQCRKEFDMYATFNVLFPNVVPSLSNVMDISVPYSPLNPREFGSKGKAIRDGFMKDSVLAAAFAKRFDLKLSDLHMSLMFNENVLRDNAQKAGGNPFDNTNTIYTGFGNDLEMNKKVERLTATGDPNKLFGRYDKTGFINKPVLMMHTIYDQLIPPTYGEVNFENMVHKQGKDQYFTVKYTNGQAHCAFTPQQTGKAFDELRSWVKTGQKAKAGYIE